ncbi:hypothetical protein C2U63_10290 [Burkholderia pseudomallei]|nr:hypothetical protein C2U63_10290 [Burkholderia pseudomallei]
MGRARRSCGVAGARRAADAVRGACGKNGGGKMAHDEVRHCYRIGFERRWSRIVPSMARITG